MKLPLDGPYHEVEALEEVHAEQAIDAVLVVERERLDDEARKIEAQCIEPMYLKKGPALQPAGVDTCVRMMASRDEYPNSSRIAGSIDVAAAPVSTTRSRS